MIRVFLAVTGSPLLPPPPPYLPFPQVLLVAPLLFSAATPAHSQSWPAGGDGQMAGEQVVSGSNRGQLVSLSEQSEPQQTASMSIPNPVNCAIYSWMNGTVTCHCMESMHFKLVTRGRSIFSEYLRCVCTKGIYRLVAPSVLRLFPDGSS